MISEAFAVWSSLFDDEISNVWATERKELKPAAMVLHTLKRELKKLEIEFDSKLNGYREKLSHADYNEIDVEQNVFLSKRDTNTSIKEKKPPLEFTLDLKDTSEISEFDQAMTGIADIDNTSDNDVTKIGTTPESPKINKSRSAIKRKKFMQLTPSILRFNNRSESKSSQSSDVSLNLLHADTVTKAEPIIDFLDSSIIENTPNVRPKIKKKKRNVPSKNATLTQMFDNEAKLNKENKQKCDDNNENGSMSLEEILDYINGDDEEKPKVEKELKTLAAKDCNPVKKNKSPNYVYKPKSVRGKARMKLPGWSCRECKEFYEELGLSPEKLKAKMNECSKHRSKFAPADDTPPGIWDLSFPPTPATFCE